MMELMEVAVADVKTTRILPDGRKRLREAGNLASLKESLTTHGQLIPIVVERDLELVDGYRRLNAFRELGRERIAAVFRDKLDDLTARTLELEANLQRLDMTWRERIFALSEIQRLRTTADPNWTQDQTAALAGGSATQSRVAEAVQLERAIKLFPELARAKSVNQAQSWLKARAAQIVRVHEVKGAPERYGSIEEAIILGDSREVVKALPGGMANLILTDPPFGIDYDERKGDTIGSTSSYEDDEQRYLSLLAMAPDLYRVLNVNGFMVWFLGMTWYERAKLAFRDAGFIVDELPVIWNRSDGRCWTSRPDRYFARGYDAALHCIKGDPQIIQRGKPNVLTIAPVPSNERELLVERPVELYAELIRRLTVPGETVVDFFTGSGSVLAAAASLKRRYLGVEQDQERRAVAIKKVHGYTPE